MLKPEWGKDTWAEKEKWPDIDIMVDLFEKSSDGEMRVSLSTERLAKEASHFKKEDNKNWPFADSMNKSDESFVFEEVSADDAVL